MGLYREIGHRIGLTDEEMMSLFSLSYYGIELDSNKNDISDDIMIIKMTLPKQGIEPFETIEKMVQLTKDTFYGITLSQLNDKDSVTQQFIHQHNEFIKSKIKFFARTTDKVWTQEDANNILASFKSV